MSTTELKPLEEMTVAELRKELGEACVDAPSGTKKELLIRLVESARSKASAAHEPPQPVDEAPAGAADAEEQAAAGAEEPSAVPGTADETVENAETIEAVRAHAQALVLREESVVAAPSLLPTVAEFTAMREMANAIANTAMVPRSFRGKGDDVLAAILTGREMGLGPMQSLRDLYVIDGKPSLAAHLLLAQLRKGGVVVLDSEAKPERAFIRAQRQDTGEIAEVEFTAEDAKDAGIASKDNWKHYPADMNWARCVGRLARRLGPDLIGNALPYTSEEVQDWDSYESGTATASVTNSTGSGWDAPNDWASLTTRLGIALGEHETPVWMEELAELGYAKESLRAILSDDEVPEETKRDLGLRLRRVLRTIEEGGDLTFAPDHRQRVQAAFHAAFDGKISLEGPAWSLQPSEGETLPSKWDALGIEAPPSPPVAAGGIEPEEAAEDAVVESPAADVPTADDDLSHIAF
jgi:hypothetical protein